MEKDSAGRCALLEYDSFDGGGPRYSARPGDPSVVRCECESRYRSPDHEQLDGAGYTVTFRLTGLREGSTTLTVESRSPLCGDEDFIYAVTVDAALNVSAVLTGHRDGSEPEVAEEPEEDLPPACDNEPGDTAGQVIASGATADIIDAGGGRLFKRFFDRIPDGGIDREIACTTCAAAVSMGAPRIFERVSDARGRGFVMERIPGRSMLDLMFEGVGTNAATAAKTLAQLQYRLNSADGSGGPDARGVMLERIAAGKLLDGGLKEKAVKLLEALPRGRGATRGTVPGF